MYMCKAETNQDIHLCISAFRKISDMITTFIILSIVAFILRINKGKTLINNYKKMNTFELKGTWEEQKGKLKQRFAVLTDNDLMFAEGKKEEMFGRLQKKLGKTKAELLSIISAL
jgi:uncharacterized protein YjbJ (UPF0337 family)